MYKPHKEKDAMSSPKTQRWQIVENLEFAKVSIKTLMVDAILRTDDNWSHTATEACRAQDAIVVAIHALDRIRLEDNDG